MLLSYGNRIFSYVILGRVTLMTLHGSACLINPPPQFLEGWVSQLREVQGCILLVHSLIKMHSAQIIYWKNILVHALCHSNTICAFRGYQIFFLLRNLQRNVLILNYSGLACPFPAWTKLSESVGQMESTIKTPSPFHVSSSGLLSLALGCWIPLAKAKHQLYMLTSPFLKSCSNGTSISKIFFHILVVKDQLSKATLLNLLLTKECNSKLSGHPKRTVFCHAVTTPCHET